MWPASDQSLGRRLNDFMLTAYCRPPRLVIRLLSADRVVRPSRTVLVTTWLEGSPSSNRTAAARFGSASTGVVSSTKVSSYEGETLPALSVATRCTVCDPSAVP